MPIYLDYMATTPVDPQVIAAMLPLLRERFGNPSSHNHSYGWQAHEAVEQATEHLADLIHADPRAITWTSGATEAINLAIKGVMARYQRQGKHLITFTTEHKAVLDTAKFLSKHGTEVTLLPITPSGLIDLDQLADALRPDTVLVSMLHVNNETGVIQDLEAISELVRNNGSLLHVDGAQSLGKVPLDMQHIDLLSLSAHKAYGPKGIGALVSRYQPGIQLQAQIHGGGHQLGLRAGTLPAHQIVGFGEACRLVSEQMDTDNQRIAQLSQRLWQGLQAKLDGLQLNGDPVQRIPHNLSISVEGVEGETLITALHKIACSRGSACTSATIEPSHVLTAMQLPRALADSTLRLSLGRFTNQTDIDQALEHLVTTIRGLREMAP